MKNELCLLTWVYILGQLLLLSEPTVALRVYHNNAYEVSNIDRRIVIPKPEQPLQKSKHNSIRRHQITLIEQLPRLQQRIVSVKPRHIIHRGYPPLISRTKHGPPLVKQRHHIGSRRQEIIHALNENTDKTDPEDDIESLGRRIDESGNEIKDGTKGDISTTALSDKHTAAATRYIIAKIKEIQEKLFKRTGSKALEEKLNQMAFSPPEKKQLSNHTTPSNATTSILTEEKKNVTVPSPTVVENKQINKTVEENSSKSKDDNSKSKDSNSEAKDKSLKPASDGSKAPDRRKIIPEEVVDKILEKFQQLKSEAKHIVSESRHSVEHAEDEGGKGWKHVGRSQSKRHRHKPLIARNTHKRNKTSHVKKKRRHIITTKLDHKERHLNVKHENVLFPVTHNNRSRNNTKATKRTFTILENGRALLNFKSGIVTDTDIPPPIGSQMTDASREVPYTDFASSPHAQYNTEAGVALPNLPPTFDFYDKQQEPIHQVERGGRPETPFNQEAKLQFAENMLQHMGSWRCSMQGDCQHPDSHDKVSAPTQKNIGLSPTMGISPEQLNSQMSVFGNEEKSLLNMASESASTDLAAIESPMGDIQSMISTMEAGKSGSPYEKQQDHALYMNGDGHSTPTSQFSFQTGVSYSGQKPYMFNNKKLLTDIFDGKMVNVKRRDDVPNYRRSPNVTRNNIPKKRLSRSIKPNTRSVKKSYTNSDPRMMSDLMSVVNEAELFSNEVLHDISPPRELKTLSNRENSQEKNYHLMRYGNLERPSRQFAEGNSHKPPFVKGLHAWIVENPVTNSFLGKRPSKLNPPNNNNIRSLAAILDNQGKQSITNKHSKEELVAANLIANAIRGALVANAADIPYKYIDKMKYEKILTRLQREIQKKRLEEMFQISRWR